MHRVTRLAGMAYAGLWLLWSTWIAFGPDGLMEAARRSPALQGTGWVEPLAWLVMTPLVGLLVSFSFARRGRFWAAAVALAFCVLFTIAARIGVDGATAPDDSCFCRPARGRLVLAASCRFPAVDGEKPAAPIAGVPRSRGFGDAKGCKAAQARHSG